MKKYKVKLGFPKLRHSAGNNRQSLFAKTVKRDWHASTPSLNVKRAVSSETDQSISSVSTEDFCAEKKKNNVLKKKSRDVHRAKFRSSNPVSANHNVPVITHSSLAAITAPGGSLNHDIYMLNATERLFSLMSYNKDFDDKMRDETIELMYKRSPYALLK
jgi:hypothetical protein